MGHISFKIPDFRTGAIEIQGVFYYGALKGHTNSVLFIMSMYGVNFIIKKIHFLFLSNSLYVHLFSLFLNGLAIQPYWPQISQFKRSSCLSLSIKWNYRYVPLCLAHQKILEKLQLKALQYSPKVWKSKKEAHAWVEDHEETTNCDSGSEKGSQQDHYQTINRCMGKLGLQRGLWWACVLFLLPYWWTPKHLQLQLREIRSLWPPQALGLTCNVPPPHNTQN